MSTGNIAHLECNVLLRKFHSDNYMTLSFVKYEVGKQANCTNNSKFTKPIQSRQISQRLNTNMFFVCTFIGQNVL